MLQNINHYVLFEIIVGFLPAELPLGKLPSRFAAWEAALVEVPARLCAHNVRSFLEALPLVDTAGLATEAQLRRAMLVLCVFAHAYVWGQLPVTHKLPAGMPRVWDLLVF